ncbi:hypothetical protein EMIHUDRAFT_195977 [Emiliania huxleyi CCMP1516]|uniref:Uncharacterized protein n=2 Tax=Emiliania huxleyi TaxID=2903 RepID=A0A0D3J391_EMIH1|nr:hypothetical protein EMIHUDRAFT_195977 [Emiliania huxleyi CCMP1516]EOD17976.1 hypothetical protein EMIHUDRAFT_195977 [Emiliania huxleyi CCMP1516]|eukprot:XP_005770405.1 hypothetical protein EMIHUDRAFT_195977 [Emiliania huxleyi CCMP1516]
MILRLLFLALCIVVVCLPWLGGVSTPATLIAIGLPHDPPLDSVAIPPLAPLLAEPPLRDAVLRTAGEGGDGALLRLLAGEARALAVTAPACQCLLSGELLSFAADGSLTGADHTATYE